MNYLSLLSGKKTYLVALVMVLYAVVYYGVQENDWGAAGKMVLEALGLAGLRNGVK